MSKPPQSVRATIVCSNNRYITLTGWSNHDDGEIFSFNKHSNTDWILQDSDGIDDITDIMNSLIQGTAIAVSDGSFLETKQAGTAAWIIEDSLQRKQLHGKLECPGSAIS
jgi:hypothetical protein